MTDQEVTQDMEESEEEGEWGRWQLPNEMIAHFTQREAYAEDADEFAEIVASMAAELLWFRNELDIMIPGSEFDDENDWDNDDDECPGCPNCEGCAEDEDAGRPN